VTSYITNDGGTAVVNTAGVDDGSLFGPGYVARYVSNGKVHSVGEGANWKQSPAVTGQWMQDRANEAVWGNQMRETVSKCKCGN
jgi:hypothetical protein